ncbi:hypothetical protein HK100_012823 [Physocladia obscura]|uniref:Uncharacterized protein n=1 Tax=Physocladia obscura TaxID=109957 RepID=A0AAD5XHC2_9FUNG|nr:hypothetical protein HK100_012823 [Physocladia obscura]
MTILSLVTSPSAKIEINPKRGSSSLVSGYFGLTNTVFVEGVICITTTVPPIHVVSVLVALNGKIFTSNGDACKHSSYESHSFLVCGPDEVFGQDHENNQTKIMLMWNETSGWEIPFSFQIKGSNMNKMHESISASNPEWGFGARITYNVTVTVKIGTMVQHTKIYRTLNTIPYTSALASAYERLYLTTITKEKPFEIVRYSPTSLKSILRNEMNKKNWSSESDTFDQDQDLGIGHNFEYEATLFSTVFGPGEVVKFEFRIRPKLRSRVKIESVRVWLEEIQGVGINIDAINSVAPSREPKPQKNNRKDQIKNEHLNNSTISTTLDRKYMIHDLLAWNGKETIEGDFWNAAQELSFEVPQLASKAPTNGSFFSKKFSGINPSGIFANRVHIEHKFRISVNAKSVTGISLPRFNLPAAIVQVTPFNCVQAMEVISHFPKFVEEVVRDSKNCSLVQTLLKPFETQSSELSLDETIVETECEDFYESGTVSGEETEEVPFFDACE